MIFDFGELETVKEEKTVKQKKDKPKEMLELWYLHCRNGNKLKTIPKNVREKMLLFSRFYDDEQIKTIVLAALKMEPENDPNDRKRFFKMFTDEKHKNLALEKLSKNMDDLFFNKKINLDIKKLYQILTEEKEWLEKEKKDFLSLCAELNDQELEDLKESLFGQKISPSDLRKTLKKNKENDQNYQEGKKASQQQEIRYDLDLLAEKKLFAGEEEKSIFEFHNSAPKGYWEKVEKELEKEYADLEEIYEKLYNEFNWHPKLRVK